MHSDSPNVRLVFVIPNICLLDSPLTNSYASLHFWYSCFQLFDHHFSLLLFPEPRTISSSFLTFIRRSVQHMAISHCFQIDLFTSTFFFVNFVHVILMTVITSSSPNNRWLLFWHYHWRTVLHIATPFYCNIYCSMPHFYNYHFWFFNGSTFTSCLFVLVFFRTRSTISPSILTTFFVLLAADCRLSSVSSNLRRLSVHVFCSISCHPYALAHLHYYR